MALIKCPECGKEISDRADKCIHCGFPLYLMMNNVIKKVICSYCGAENLDTDRNCANCGALLVGEEAISAPKTDKSKTVCGNELINGIMVDVPALILRHKNVDGSRYIVATEISKITGCRYSEAMPYVIKYENTEIEDEYVFDGIYKIGFGGKKTEVYCPRCRSSKCSYFQQEKVVPGITKTRYSANLNPLRPFTLVNKKEKVIKPEKIVTESKIQCQNCGFVFK